MARYLHEITIILINLLLLFLNKNYRVAKGEFGLKVILLDKWSTSIGEWMKSKGIYEIELNYIHGSKTSKDGIFNSGCNVDTYDFLYRDIPFLSGLSIVGQNAENFSELEKLKKLRALSIEVTKKPKKFNLGELEDLEVLSIEWFSGAESLFDCKKLRHLCIDNISASIASENFSKLEKLESLRLAGGALEDIVGLNNLECLNDLVLLSIKKLSSLKGIGKLDRLKSLRIESCKNISSIKPLNNLKNIEVLWIDDCGSIDSLEPIKNLMKLKWLQFTQSTNILDGDLKVLYDFPVLKDCEFKDRRHYNANSSEFE